MVNITGFAAAAKSAVQRVSRSPYLKSIEDIGNDTVQAVLEKNGKRVIRFIEGRNRFCNNSKKHPHHSSGAHRHCGTPWRISVHLASWISHEDSVH